MDLTVKTQTPPYSQHVKHRGCLKFHILFFYFNVSGNWRLISRGYYVGTIATRMSVQLKEVLAFVYLGVIYVVFYFLFSFGPPADGNNPEVKR
jgi:hypothetical protein